LITNFFDENGIPYKDHMIGFGADGEAVNFGANNSLMTKFKADIPNLFFMMCLCHSLAKCVEWACRKLPREVDHLIRDTYCHFKYSSVKTNELAGMAEFLNIPARKLLKLFDTRWLSLRDCVHRYLQMYDPIFHYFKKEVDSKRSKGDVKVKAIFERLQNPFNKIYLKFLDFILPIITDVNLEFQCEKPKIHVMYRRMENLFKTVGLFYLKEKYVEENDVRSIDFNNPANFVDLFKIDLGAAANSELSLINRGRWESNLKVFLTNCLNFYVELMNEIYKRFPFNKPEAQFLKEASFIDPVNLRDMRSIFVIPKFFNMNITEVDHEYRTLRRRFKDSIETDVDEFWAKVRTMRKGDGSYEFPKLLEIVKKIKLLPHSSSACERGFSDVNNNKTKKRNQLKSETLQAILQGKDLLRLSKTPCYKFTPNDRILSYFNSFIYKK